MTHTIRASEPCELLALVPYQLGFMPRDSVVVVGLQGPRRRVGMMIRTDLADIAHPRSGPQLARNLVAAVARDGSSSVVIVVYRDDDLEDGSDLDREAVTALARLREATVSSLEVRAVLASGASSYHEVLPRGVLAPGRPLRDLESTAVGARMVFDGVAVLADRDDLGRIPVVSAAHRRVARRAAHDSRRPTIGPDKDSGGWRTRSLDAWHRGVRAAMRDATQRAHRLNRPSLWGQIGEALEDKTVRDAVLVTLVPGTGTVAARFCASDGRESNDEVGLAVRAIADPEVALAPDPALLEPARGVLRHVVAHREGGSAPALTLLGLTAWWTGHGAEAAVWIDRALEADPHHSLARLVREALDAGLPPGWVRRARTEGEHER
ncbi:DUF4192 domain-containing protein [Sanguibacter sp. A247]|uniref:DUF4192 domain-containing protein n=1 Tax=unclassified Sanguibacter TaxID=2645534 RepID=UPI003FD78A85